MRDSEKFLFEVLNSYWKRSTEEHDLPLFVHVADEFLYDNLKLWRK